jgi:hypothetical protein
MARMDIDEPRWSTDVHQADWIAERLTSWGKDSLTVGSVIPGGFEAYARVLHPAEAPDNGDRLVRWADVAAWSGMPLRNDAQFHSIALPPTDPGGPPPFGGQGPRKGSLYPPDAEVVASIARAWTSVPEDCWFCVWDGFGWNSVGEHAVLTATDEPSEVVREPRRDPVPEPVRNGPRVRLPHRDYLLYKGPAGAVVATAGLAGGGQCANLWWPADRAWCVASEIDLQSTYVGGPRGLIDAIVADTKIEALPASTDDPVSRVEDWVTAWVDQLADGLLARGEAALATSRGSVEAWLRRPGRLRKGELRIQATGARGGYGSSGTYRGLGSHEDLRAELTLYLTLAVLELADM